MEAKDTRIYMIVDTEKIKPGNEDECVELKDDRDNRNPRKDPENFLSVVNPHKNVFWFGQPKDRPQDTIGIIGIENKSGSEHNFLKDKRNDPSDRGAYMAEVKTGFEDGMESSYNIIFEIKGRNGQFTVDPKLMMKT
ncbi:MAG: hypothetical protein R3209_00795 [Salinimicrobium sediminis]|nr:hypothetical protein [Salinimicrobium sediminis]